MKPILMATCATALSLAAIVPAQAAWDQLGTVSVDRSREHVRVYQRFGGPVERLWFSADQGDAYCRSIRVTFNNGRTRTVFSGTLREDRGQTVDLPGYQRNIRRIDFRCRSLERGGSEIKIAADIGRYRSAWRQSPDWARWWSRMFTWNDMDRGDRGERSDYVRLGRTSFSGNGDTETVAAPGRADYSMIALQPVDGEARCSQVRVEFANGRTRTLNIDSGDRLREDRMYNLDLPGNERDVVRVRMACEAVNDNDVTIDVYGGT
jgi:hypothetical protein